MFVSVGLPIKRTNWERVDGNLLQDSLIQEFALHPASHSFTANFLTPTGLP